VAVGAGAVGEVVAGAVGGLVAVRQDLWCPRMQCVAVVEVARTPPTM